MFSKNRRRSYNISGNNQNKNSTAGLGEKGIQDSLKAAQVIFQRHSNDANLLPTTTHVPKEVPVLKKQPPKLQSRPSISVSTKNKNSSKDTNNTNTNNTNTKNTNNNNNNNNNIPNQIKKRQQRDGEISRPTSRQTNKHLQDFPERDRLRQPSPLPVSSRTSRSPSPSSGSSSSSRSASGSLYYSTDHIGSLNNTQKGPEKEAQSSKTYKESNEVANIAASLAQKHIDSHIEPKKPSSMISGKFGHGSRKKQFYKHSLKENIELVDALLEKSKLEHQRRDSMNKNYDPRDLLLHNIPTQRKVLKDKTTTTPPSKHLPSEPKVNKDFNPAAHAKQDSETTSINSHMAKHHRIPPPILISSEDMESMTSHSQNSINQGSKAIDDGSIMDDLNSSMVEYDSDDRSNVSWDEGEEDDDNNSYYVDGYDSPNIESGDSNLQILPDNHLREDIQSSDEEKGELSAYYNSPVREEEEEEDCEDDIFTLESTDEHYGPLSLYSDDDDDDLYNQEGVIQSPLKSKGKKKKVRRLGKILKATKNKVYSPEPSQLRDKRPTNAPVKLKETMRYDAKKSFNEDKPWKRHRDVRYIEEPDRKRYEGVWVTNRFSYLNLLSWWPRDLVDDAQENSTEVSTTNEKNNTKSVIDLPKDGLILNIVVRSIWERSNLPNEILCQIYNLVDTRRDNTLDRRSFIVGMWLVDQCLYGRKLPDEVPSMVWDSVDSYTMNLIQSRIEMESRQKKNKSKRTLMKRELKHIKHGIKHVHL